MMDNSKPYRKDNRQQRTVTGKSLVIYIILALLVLASLVALSVFLTRYDAEMVTKAGSFQNVKYISGAEYEDVVSGTDKMTAVSDFSAIKKGGGDSYVRLSFQIPSSDSTRELSLYTYFSQSVVQINDTEALNTVNTSGLFSDTAHQILSIAPSANPVTVDIIIKCTVLPKLRITVTSPNNAARYTEWIIPLALLLLSVISLFVYSIGSIRRRKSALNAHFSFDWIPFLVFGGSAICFFSLKLTGSWLFLTRFGIAVIMLSEMMLINYMYKRVLSLEKLRQIVVSTGLVLTAVTLTGQYQAMTILLIKVYGLYIPVFLLLLFIVFMIKPHRCHFTPSEVIFCTLFSSLHFIIWSIFFLNVVTELLYIPLFACILYFLSVGMNFINYKEPQAGRSGHFINSQELMIYKPMDMGKLQDLMEIFLKNEDNLIHARNVSLYVYTICKNSDMTEEQSKLAAQASFLHDIGKMMLPKKLTTSASPLNDSEYEEMKKHTMFGYTLFAAGDSDLMRAAAIVAKEHHERFDGNGYYGLAGDQIHVFSQITSIADVFDATTTERSYKKAWTFDEGFEYIKENCGSLFSNKYVDVFIQSRDDIYNVYGKIHNV